MGACHKGGVLTPGSLAPITGRTQKVATLKLLCQLLEATGYADVIKKAVPKGGATNRALWDKIAGVTERCHLSCLGHLQETLPQHPVVG